MRIDLIGLVGISLLAGVSAASAGSPPEPLDVARTPWDGVVPWRPAAGPLFDSTGHAGNYGMANLLTLLRSAEPDDLLLNRMEAVQAKWLSASPSITVNSVLDGVFTAIQSSQGERAFARTCSNCHSEAEFSGGRFRIRWVGQSIGDLFDTVSTLMPEDNPGSLTPEVYASLVAYLLDLNGYPDGQNPLPPDLAVLNLLDIVANSR